MQMRLALYGHLNPVGSNARQLTWYLVFLILKRVSVVVLHALYILSAPYPPWTARNIAVSLHLQLGLGSNK